VDNNADRGSKKAVKLKRSDSGDGAAAVKEELEGKSAVSPLMDKNNCVCVCVCVCVCAYVSDLCK
jgi:hypothetical protein